MDSVPKLRSQTLAQTWRFCKNKKGVNGWNASRLILYSTNGWWPVPSFEEIFSLFLLPFVEFILFQSGISSGTSCKSGAIWRRELWELVLAQGFQLGSHATEIYGHF